MSEPHTSRLVSAIYESIGRTRQPAFFTPTRTVSWMDWLGIVEGLVERFEPLRGARTGILFRSSEISYALLLALSMLEGDVFVIDQEMSGPEIEELAALNDLDAMIDPRGEGEQVELRDLTSGSRRSCSGRGEVTIFTSGSTGRPKAVRHDWYSLTRPVRKRRSPIPQCWLLTYRPHLYGGLQVFLHCLVNQDPLAIPERDMSVDALLDLMRRSDVRSVSATPSYWRRLIALGSPADLGALQLQQITLGGEVADQHLLNVLSRYYPGARLVHLYATSEVGRCFTVTDGRAGFPAHFLDVPSDDGIALKLEDGELYVRSANAMRGAPAAAGADAGGADWFATGDLVERVGDRCYFVGRRDDLINVGGNKVRPLRVEQVIQGVPGVRDVRVFARSSSLVGQMVACEYVTEPGFEPEAIKSAILKTCLERLEAHERPRFVQVVSTIGLSSADKKIRKLSRQ
jgi:acyl-coenzyme A synthetase/AMP-(fatty) acid ligase